MQAAPLVVLPPARRTRLIALVLSAVAVVFAVGFGVLLRKAYFVDGTYEDALPWILGAMVLLLVALLLRMAAAICELLWLERTWSNLPEELRRVGPVEKVSSGMMVGLSLVPGVAWLWKLGLVASVADGLEQLRARVPFRAPVPKRLGLAAVVVGWIPGLNVYVAPFLWEAFARRIDLVCDELNAAHVAARLPLRPPGP